MKKKIIISVIITIAFSLIVLTSCFIAISNYQYIDSIKSSLAHYNILLEETILDESKDNNQRFDAIKRLGEDIRFSYINKDGKVIYDTDTELDKLDNHQNREEIVMAKKTGSGTSVRYSKTLNKNMVYCASKLRDGSIVRTSVPMNNVKIFQNENIKYYLIILVFVIILSILLSIKLTKMIIAPVKELQFITSRIAKGELDRRVNIRSVDELDSLGKTFNNMADQLNHTMDELIDKQNRLQAILKSMDSGVIAVDRLHRVIMINPYAKKIFGIEKDIIGEQLIDHIRDFEFDSVFDSSDDYKEIKIIWPKERELRIRTAEIINGTEHMGTVAVVQDITDIKKLENMRSQFVANVSHELKTPLTSIKGFAETLKYVDDEVNKEKFLNIINEEAERLTRLINDILTLSNIEQNSVPVKEWFLPEDIIDNVYTLMKIEAEKKNINFVLVKNSNVEIKGDPDKFKQMIINLVENAIKYSEEKDSVTVKTEFVSGKVIITVDDTGPGIPERDLSRIFERFYRVDKARSRSKGGTGLGLAIVKHIVKSFNGNIDVYSKLGEGTKFVVSIKAKKKK
ncbi:two-component system, OmpR family, phosphate regulon sensor histidine kinase PhoR [Clostridium cavendishii DSM 21758]|uniref:histidine kinase n=1 Tax=Clostridium cavendishii DSM 21758 TaxID=1121302 RepID=A0A1M6KCI7_9CLOT|nr:ATP-binding protein [Clostridium cavendishii]SHJ56671.1 two-component system, OmpR family, phosphate regulon sensor histidine kinase PhoR [Clostridium cavendishii DSM 21758]